MRGFFPGARHRRDFLLTLPATSMGLALCIQISALSWFLSTRLNLHASEIGWVWAGGPIAGIVGQLLVARLSDQAREGFGRRIPFIIGAAAGVWICFAALQFLPAGTIWPAVSLVLALDLLVNIGLNPARALISDSTSAGQARLAAFARLQLVSGAVGVGAYLFAGSFGNERLLRWGAPLVLVLAALPALAGLREQSSGQNSSASEVTRDTNPRAGSASRSTFEIDFSAHAFNWFGMQAVFVFWVSFTQRRFAELDPESIGRLAGNAFAVLNTVGFLLPYWVLLPLARRWGGHATQAACVLLMALAWGIAATREMSPRGMLFVMALAGIGWAGMLSLPMAIFSESAPAKAAGMRLGIFNLAVVLPQLAVSLLLGRLLDHWPASGALMFVASGACLISALLWAASACKHHRRHRA